ncbi:DUF885 domain-containing protein [Brachybacterium sp. AOP25-B2-12]|uniref:DUF885 domain-containing protein n=1 Tax=Brachybacterium sp. AOP25-B2-12 TaxID=3457710 RepID=UPI004034B8CA
MAADADTPSVADAGAPRRPSALDALADGYVDHLTSIDPFLATSLGVPGHDDEVTDLSPAGIDARLTATRALLASIATVPDQDDVDAVTRAALTERLGLELEHDEAWITRSQVNNIASGLQTQAIFDLMDDETPEDWQIIATRLRRLPAAMRGWTETLREAAASGHVSARRQLVLGAEQARGYADPDGGYFAQLAARAPEDEAVRAAVAEGVAAASAAYREVADVLDELAPSAPSADACGREAYPLHARTFLGEEIDVDETYAWGIEELRRIIDEQRVVARRLNDRYRTGAGDSIEAARAALDADPARTLHGTEALRSWMQETADRALRELSGVHFDIPEPLHRIECRIAETGSGGIYYTPPSQDLSRPGRMWWDVPPGTEEFHTWAETTTVYHEGVPGHHLQCGIQTMRAAELNRWRALLCWVSGHGEGWALYAERLMADLGYLEDDGDRLGMLDAQRLRAGRVVLDVGLHNDLAMPEGVVGSAGGPWTYASAWEFMTPNWGVAEAERRFELHRYLGWPGQAPSYKLGQRVWDELRAGGTTPGDDASVRDFHRRALDLGSLPLSVLRSALSPRADGPRAAETPSR